MEKTCESVTIIVANSAEKSVPVGYYLMDVEEPSKDPDENVTRYRQAVAAATVYCNTLNIKMRDIIYEHKQESLCYKDCILFTPLGSPLTIFNTQIALAKMFLVYNKCGFMIEAISLEETLEEANEKICKIEESDKWFCGNTLISNLGSYKEVNEYKLKDFCRALYYEWNDIK